MCLYEEGKGRDFVPIAHICNAFVTKFGIPRQSGIVDEIISRVEFEPEYRDPNAFRGILGYSHLWLLWEFSEHRKALVTHSKTAKAWGKYARWCICNALPVSPEPDWTFLCAPFGSYF